MSDMPNQSEPEPGKTSDSLDLTTAEKDIFIRPPRPQVSKPKTSGFEHLDSALTAAHYRSPEELQRLENEKIFKIPNGIGGTVSIRGSERDILQNLCDDLGFQPAAIYKGDAPIVIITGKDGQVTNLSLRGKEVESLQEITWPAELWRLNVLDTNVSAITGTELPPKVEVLSLAGSALHDPRRINLETSHNLKILDITNTPLANNPLAMAMLRARYPTIDIYPETIDNAQFDETMRQTESRLAELLAKRNEVRETTDTKVAHLLRQNHPIPIQSQDSINLEAHFLTVNLAEQIQKETANSNPKIDPYQYLVDRAEYLGHELIIEAHERNDKLVEAAHAQVPQGATNDVAVSATIEPSTINADHETTAAAEFNSTQPAPMDNLGTTVPSPETADVATAQPSESEVTTPDSMTQSASSKLPTAEPSMETLAIPSSDDLGRVEQDPETGQWRKVFSPTALADLLRYYDAGQLSPWSSPSPLLESWEGTAHLELSPALKSLIRANDQLSSQSTACVEYKSQDNEIRIDFELRLDSGDTALGLYFDADSFQLKRFWNSSRISFQDTSPADQTLLAPYQKAIEDWLAISLPSAAKDFSHWKIERADSLVINRFSLFDPSLYVKNKNNDNRISYRLKTDKAGQVQLVQEDRTLAPPIETPVDQLIVPLPDQPVETVSAESTASESLAKAPAEHATNELDHGVQNALEPAAVTPSADRLEVAVQTPPIMSHTPPTTADTETTVTPESTELPTPAELEHARQVLADYEAREEELKRLLAEFGDDEV